MILNNILNGLIAFVIAIFLTIGFYSMFNGILNILPSETKIFIGTIMTLTILYIGFWAPIEIITIDDTGEMN